MPKKGGWVEGVAILKATPQPPPQACGGGARDPPRSSGMQRARRWRWAWAGRALGWRTRNGRGEGASGQRARLRGLLGGLGLARLAGRAGWPAHAGSGRAWADHGPHPGSEAGAQKEEERTWWSEV